MKIIKNQPTLPPPPPVTYDIVGLTQTEASYLRAILGAINGRLTHPCRQVMHPIWRGLVDASVPYPDIWFRSEIELEDRP